MMAESDKRLENKVSSCISFSSSAAVLLGKAERREKKKKKKQMLKLQIVINTALCSVGI